MLLFSAITFEEVKSFLSAELEGFTIFDALSDCEFYKRGIVENSVVLTRFVENLINNAVRDLWVYACMLPNKVYSNRFMAMPFGRICLQPLSL